MKKLFRIKLVLALLAGLLVADIGPAAQPAQAANGTCASNGTVTEGDSGNYHWVKFTVTTNSSGNATCTFRTPVGVSIISVLSVSGGGGGGHDGGGGGGGGGVLYYDQMQLNDSTDYSVIVGAGGAAAGSSCSSGNCPEGIDGNLSKFNNNYAAGGGGGGGRYSAGNSAGTGGGAGHTGDATVLSGGTGSGYADGYSVTYGRNGGNNSSNRGGGGGGAATAGNNAADTDAGFGGKGFTSSIDGTSRVYGGGGGGGTYTGNARSIVNVGGGGTGGNNTNNGANGSDGFGGGGGGGGDADNPAGRGGSGVVIVRYLTVDTCATPTPVTVGSEVYLKFVTTSESRSCLKSWTVPTGVNSVQLLVVGGGGSGGTRRGTLGGGGGGGAGGFRTESSFSVTPDNSISILVGGGGAAQTVQQDAWGFDGNLSYFSTVIAEGGGGGGAYCGGAADLTETGSSVITLSINGRNGGSGGGGGRCSSSTGGAAANASYGNAGGSANANLVSGGGGGKGSAGNSGGAVSNPGKGGDGATSTITGSTVTYAAGGGGSGETAALGGSSIGGTGARENVSAATAGSSQTGSGGGGGYASSGAGGSGVVIVRYQPGPLNVTFDSLGGSEVTSTTVLTSETLPAPTAPTRAGYNFNGWATASYGTPITFPYTHNQTANFTLYAQWGAKSLTIVYNTQDGSPIPNGAVLTGSYINPAPATPTRDGYTFNGWFVAPTGGTAISNFSTYTHNQTSNFTLYAQWSVTAPNLSSVTVTGTALSGSIITATPSATGLGTITFSYQWYRILSGLGTFLIDGATSSTYTLTDSDLLGYAFVRVIATNEGGSSSTVTGSMSPTPKVGVVTPTISGSLQSGQLLTGATSSTIPAGATSKYQWLSSDSAAGTYTSIDKATNTTYRLTSSDVGKYIKFAITILEAYLGTSLESSSAATNVVGVGAPTISSQPTSATKYAGQSVTFSVTASASDSGSLSYQWKKNAIDIKDATSSSYVINSVTSGDAGSYTVVVTNTLNGTIATATSNAALLTFGTPTELGTPNTPGTTTVTGSTTSIVVTYTAVTNATSHTVKVYQSGVLVGSARTSFVSGTTITGLTAGTTYTVTVTAMGDGTVYNDSAESAASTIMTNAAAVVPTIDSQPASATKYAGQSVDFTVVASASDSGSLSYQWKKNGTDINGAITSSYAINSVSSGDAGDYTVVVTNTLNGTTATETSNAAVLTFATATQLTTPSAPTVSATSGTTTSITVSFTSVANASSHTVRVYQAGLLVGSARTSFISGSTITGLSPNTTYTVTVTAIGDGTIYSDSAASTTASVTTNEFLGSALTPEIDGVESTLDGFRMSLKNYDSNFTYSFSLTNGALASINSSGVITVTNLAPGASSTITITTTRTNYPSASASTSGTAISIKTVTFNANGGSGTMSAQTGRSSATLNENIFTRQYYNFLRWNTESNGTGNDYDDLATYSFSGDLTLYALWSPIPLTVTYDSQDGTPVSNGATTYLGKISSAPTPPPTRSGYTLLGWSATPSGSVVSFEYTHNQNSNFTMYAIWRLDVAVPTISSQPVSANKYSGQSVTFSVTSSVSDSGVLSYQWKKNGTNISGAIASSFAINSVASSDAGDYTVVVTNTNNGETSSVTSDVARLNFVATTQLSTPSAPTVSATSGSTTSITVSFTAVSNADSHTVKVYASGVLVGAAHTSFTSGSTVTGLTAGTTYTVTITAIGDGSIYSDSAASSAATVTTNSAATNTNTIIFATISNKTYGDSFTVTVSASSGLTVTVSSSTTSVCTVSTLTVTAISVGTCTLVAAQGGNGTYPAATSVTNTFTVGKKSLVITASDQSGTVGSATSAPSYSQNGLVTALGDAIGSVSYTYVGSGSTRYAQSSSAPASGGNWILGTYKITPASLVLSSGSASNYNISYAHGTLTVSGTSTKGISGISVKSTGLNKTTELLTGFSVATTSYGIYVESAVSSVSVVITRTSGSLASAQVSVNDSGFRRLSFTSNAANSGILALPQQSNTITLKIVATDLSVQTYTISILRDQATSSATGGVATPTPTASPRPADQVISSARFFANSATGDGSSLLEVAMTSPFSTATFSYTVNFANKQSVTQLRTLFSDPGLTIRIKMNQGAFRTIPSSGASTSLALNEGANTAILRVASSDGTVADYTFTLNRAA